MHNPFKKIIVKTRNLNQSAFLTAMGGALLQVDSIYPNNFFIIETRPIVLWYEKHIGIIPYRKFCNQRVRLKDRGRKLAKLPENFVGRKEGFNFAEIAQVKEFTQKEKEKYAV